MKMNVSFVTSAADETGYPDTNRCEIALAGRSNAGKSSFINALTRGQIAKVSQVPGKTRLLNFFDVGEHYRLVDMPGYGFSSRSGKEQHGWQNLVETYLAQRENLMGVILIMDSRRKWHEDEKTLVQWLESIQCPVLVALTKSDKLKKAEQKATLSHVKKLSQLQNIFMCSSKTREGIAEIEDFMFTQWVRPHVK